MTPGADGTRRNQFPNKKLNVLAGDSLMTMLLLFNITNGLIIGAPDLAEAAVAGIGKGVRQPVVRWSPDQAIDLPELATGTLVGRFGMK